MNVYYFYNNNIIKNSFCLSFLIKAIKLPGTGPRWYLHNHGKQVLLFIYSWISFSSNKYHISTYKSQTSFFLSIRLLYFLCNKVIDNLLWKDRSDAWESFGHKDRESLILPLTETPKSYFILEQIRQLYFCPKWPHAVSLVKSLYLWKQLFHRTLGVPRFNVTSILGALVGTVTNGWWWVWTLYKVWYAKKNNSEAATLGQPFASPGSFQTSSLTYQSRLLERLEFWRWCSFRLRACGAQASSSRARSVWGSPFSSPCPISSAPGTSPTGAWRLSSAFLYGRSAFCPLSSPLSLLLPFNRRQGTTSQLTRAPCLHKLAKKRRAQNLDPHSLSSNPCSVLPGREVLGRPLTFSGKGDSDGAQIHSVTAGTEEVKLFVDSAGGGGGKHKVRAVS